MTYTKLNKEIMQLFLVLNILEPIQFKDQNTIKVISERLNIRTYFYEGLTEVNNLDGKPNVFLNKNQSEQKVWQDYGHALGHLSSFNDLLANLPSIFKELQSNEINEFAYLFCIPSFMLEQLHDINEDAIVHSFNVEYNFAQKRIALYEDNLTGVTKNG
ncbi:hypothetical protein CIL03_08345 [Virgibacillus indicus]|uniref:IrrE N-terminal-like domain-containing protein n=1 Tax=Virgibacillus indicus TaxID=2024554 RepID=A0A265NB15_9BACI|nr:ImmA/IrrE family metallo-endopeptidase [Virgibacillus indicus]OZU89017.1 hypothetical protein CIL03_08345 [Virgibacillus indicus]